MFAIATSRFVTYTDWRVVKSVPDDDRCAAHQENFGHPVFDCLNPSGELMPAHTAAIRWRFSPLEAKTYKVPVAIPRQIAVDRPKFCRMLREYQLCVFHCTPIAFRCPRWFSVTFIAPVTSFQLHGTPLFVIVYILVWAKFKLFFVHARQKSCILASVSTDQSIEFLFRTRPAQSMLLARPLSNWPLQCLQGLYT